MQVLQFSRCEDWRLLLGFDKLWSIALSAEDDQVLYRNLFVLVCFLCLLLILAYCPLLGFDKLSSITLSAGDDKVCIFHMKASLTAAGGDKGKA